MRERVLKNIERLATDPKCVDVHRLRGRPETRLRVGSWRVLFELDHEHRTIVVVRVLPRDQVYRS